MQAAGTKNPALPLVAWEVAEGDPLLALAYALERARHGNRRVIQLMHNCGCWMS